jgi:hypothetical protein
VGKIISQKSGFDKFPIRKSRIPTSFSPRLFASQMFKKIIDDGYLVLDPAVKKIRPD